MRALIVPALLTLVLFGAVPSGAEVIVPVGVFGTYLRVDPTDTAMGPTVIVLADHGIAPGMLLQLRALGDFDNGPGGDEFVTQLAVFSSGSTLLGPDERYRVPGALGTTRVGGSGTTCPSGLPTDIPEDFYVQSDTNVVVVPAGATHLFVMPGECYFVDNSDPDLDYAVGLAVLGTVGVEPDAPVAMLSPAWPNPARSEARIAFRLASTSHATLTVHAVDGRRVRTLARASLAAGAHELRWDLRDERGNRAAPGVYYARLDVGATSSRQRAIIVVP